MYRIFTLLAVFLVCFSCIPYKIAPKIADYKTVKGKRFKRGLPKKTLFVFKDPKAAGEFYNFVNTKYQLQDYYVDVEVPFSVANNDYYFSFYEVEKKDGRIQLLPIIFDVTLNAALRNEDFETYAATDANTIAERENYYVAIEVFTRGEEDCLQEGFVHRQALLDYLSNLKEEYRSTHNYNEIVFKNR